MIKKLVIGALLVASGVAIGQKVKITGNIKKV